MPDAEKDAYWRGKTDGRLAALEESHESINKKLDELLGFKNKMLGISAALSMTVAGAVEGAKHWIQHAGGK